MNIEELKYKIKQILSGTIDVLCVTGFLTCLISILYFLWFDNSLLYLKLTVTGFILGLVCNKSNP